ncbi:MAG: glycosyltransferase family 4 protein [Bacteroidota bacterium]|jgi:glycosyltransferase involved in cell wall biosynthesis
MKNVLIIAYYFPPTGGGGVQRTLKFVKYLPAFGWIPTVLTVKNPDFDDFDASLSDDIPPATRIYRIGYFDPIRWYRTHRYGPHSRFEPMGQGIFADKKKPFHRFLLLPIKGLWNLFRRLLIDFVLIPDDLLFWIPVAVLKGIRVIKENKIDVVYATGPPWSSYVIAYFLGLITNKPYVLDMRDPWILSPYEADSHSIRRKLCCFWERKSFSSARYVINITEDISNSYEKFYSKLSPNKFITITQGFDPDDFLDIKIDRSDKFIISHIGTMYDIRTPENFLKAIKHLTDTAPEVKDNLKIRFIGITGSYTNDPMTRYKLQDIVDVIPYLPHRESIKNMKESSALLLIISKVQRSETQTPTGKLYEYLASRRPILGLVPAQNDAAKLIAKFDAGIITDPDDVQGIEDSVVRMYRSHKNGELRDHTGDISMFSRKELTKELASILDRASR